MEWAPERATGSSLLRPLEAKSVMSSSIVEFERGRLSFNLDGLETRLSFLPFST